MHLSLLPFSEEYFSCLLINWWMDSIFPAFLKLNVNISDGPFDRFSVKKLGSSSGRFSNATLVRLSEFLSAGYKKGVRPVKDWRTSTTVAIDLMVYSILNVVSCHSRSDITDCCLLDVFGGTGVWKHVMLRHTGIILCETTL